MDAPNFLQQQQKQILSWTRRHILSCRTQPRQVCQSWNERQLKGRRWGRLPGWRRVTTSGVNDSPDQGTTCTPNLKRDRANLGMLWGVLLTDHIIHKLSTNCFKNVTHVQQHWHGGSGGTFPPPPTNFQWPQVQIKYFVLIVGDRTIARWMQPPNKTFRSSAGYHGLIDARIPAKENSVRKENVNSH